MVLVFSTNLDYYAFFIISRWGSFFWPSELSERERSDFTESLPNDLFEPLVGILLALLFRLIWLLIVTSGLLLAPDALSWLASM